MKRLKGNSNKLSYSAIEKNSRSDNENGSAIVIALLIMILLLGFVAFAITRTNSETIAASNDASETRTFEAAQASLEVMTRNFDKIFDVKINASPADLTRIEGQMPPEFPNYGFNQRINQTAPGQQVVMTGQQYQGLFATRDEWLLDTTATEIATGVQVQLRRSFFNNRIPIFQFGIFYDDDLEFHPGPRFDFGGRVHSNGSLFLKSGNELRFSSKVSASSDVYTDVMRNGTASTTNGVRIKNASGAYVNLDFNMGSVLNGTVNGAPVSTNPDMPVAYRNSNWDVIEKLFQGNLLSRQSVLELPIRLESNINDTSVNYVELVKRGRDVNDLWNDKSLGTPTAPNLVPVNATTRDSEITSRQRYYNGTGIRISLADSKAKLPGCASGTGTAPTLSACGIRLDGAASGNGSEPTGGNPRGYQPLTMSGGYQGTEINGERFYVAGKEVWIKVETVALDSVNNVTVTTDITADFLSLGVTDAPVYIPGSFAVNGYGIATTSGNQACVNNPNAKDCRSVIKLQRFVMEGPRLTDNNYITSDTWLARDFNYILSSSTGADLVDTGTFASFAGDHIGHRRAAVVRNTGATRTVVPFPIKLFDTREGTYCDGCRNQDTTTFNPTNNPVPGAKDGYGTNVPWIGVMSLVDIDIANLKRFLDNEFGNGFPNGLTASSIPEKNGWILYVSDRRGDFDFDGEFDMEDIYGKNDCSLQAGEDVNTSGNLDSGGLCVGTTLNLATSTGEAPTYFAGGLATSASVTPWRTSFVAPQIAATLEHRFYRRGVRLINAQRIPGVYDSTNPANTKGFTFASENGVYVRGNYNATGIVSVGSPTASTEYLPQDTPAHIPASIAADAITILSSAWMDARSFTSPFNSGARVPTETAVRFAMLAGDAKSSLAGVPSQSPFNEPRLGGGVHNFKRFLENWSGTRLNYAGSLINLYYAHNNNGTYKTGYVYGAPTRNWVFDSSFLDPNRLPPGTPFFQFLQLTGFQRVN